VCFVIFGPVQIPQSLTAFSDRIERVDYVDWKRLPSELARLDICIAPLAGNAFNQCKSDIKWLEASLVCVPTVASPVGQLGESIIHGRTGMLAGTPRAWSDALSMLIETPERGDTIAKAAREQVLRERTDEVLGPALVATLQAL
jgi:glycosyltransferase involved in cell wall biosynthesis